MPLTQYKSWNDPDALTALLSSEIQQSSGNFIGFQIVKHSIIRTYPTKPGGFVFTDSQYLGCLSDSSPSYCGAIIDYQSVLNTLYDSSFVTACSAISAGVADEIWLWGAPWFGYWEYNFISPNTYCSGVNKRITVMGFNYERTDGEALHSFGHRSEGALYSALGLTLWDKFDGQRQRYSQDGNCPPQPDATHPEVDPNNTHVGNVHFPPNAYCHYQYDRNFSVLSDAEDWRNYPNLTGQKTAINSVQYMGREWTRLSYVVGYRFVDFKNKERG